MADYDVPARAPRLRGAAVVEGSSMSAGRQRLGDLGGYLRQNVSGSSDHWLRGEVAGFGNGVLAPQLRMVVEGNAGNMVKYVWC